MFLAVIAHKYALLVSQRSCGHFLKLSDSILSEQVIARPDYIPPPIAADLRPCADGSTVRTDLVACRAAALLIAYGAAGVGVARIGQLGQIDGRTDRAIA